MSLLVRNVWKSFTHKGATQHVLRDVDLIVEPGSFVTLAGHSGCGKSTLINLLGGLTRPDAGEISLDGTPVRDPGPDRAMVFQNYSLLPRCSVVDNVRIAVRSARPDRSKEQVDEVTERYLTAVGLWDAKDKKPYQVSGGMQQRAAVARGFAVEPRVLLLDEPFGALDALTRARLQTQLVELWTSGSDTEMVVMVTHSIDEAVRLSDHIVVLGPPPGPSVLEVIPVPIARPRDRTTHARALEKAHERLYSLLEAEPVVEQVA